MVEFTQAYVLHHRPYRETSLLLDVLTADHGRVSLVARGQRQSKRRHHNPFQLFQPLWISWFGRGDLLTLNKIEVTSAPYLLYGHASLCGLYINELLIRLISQHQPEPQIFSTYQITLEKLQQAENPELSLRLFEKHLLLALGYGVDLGADVKGQRISKEQHYGYVPAQGLFPCEANDKKRIISGESLQQFHLEKFTDAFSLNETKQLMRLIINYYLDGKPLKSRQLFAEMQRYAGPKTVF